MADTRTPVAAPRQQFINLDLVHRIVLCDGLNGTSRSVLLTVGMHASQDRQQCFCSIATLARKSGWSRRTITQHLARLQQLGYLRLIGTHDSGTGIYQVRLERLCADVTPVPRHGHSRNNTDTAQEAAAHSAPSARAAPFTPAASAPAPAPTSPVPAPAPPPPAEPPATPCADGAHPPSANCAPPTHQPRTNKGLNKGLNNQGRKKPPAPFFVFNRRCPLAKSMPTPSACSTSNASATAKTR